MKLSPNAVIAKEKVISYLLQRRLKNDKSKFLEQAGYSVENWKQLEDDIRKQILPEDAEFVESNKFGEIYRIKSTLIGLNGKQLNVVTIWIILHTTKETRFVTLFPDKETIDEI